MTAFLLTIGDEILIGQTLDTNSAWISKQLNLQGFRVIGKYTVADTREAILQGLEYASREADVVIMTGGLGPTKDDITKSTLAEYFDSPMSLHAETYERISAYYAKIGRAVPDSTTLQATVPDKARLLTNKVGSAPGMWFEGNGKVFISLPGVPFEMEYLMQHEVLPKLDLRFEGRHIAHRTLLTVGAGESAIAERLQTFEETLPANIKLAYLPSLGQVRLRLTGTLNASHNTADEQELENRLDAKALELKTLLPELVCGADDDSLEAVLGRMLLERRMLFGTAESCTGGYIAHMITSVPGASDYYPGTIVSYSYEMKTKLLGVRPDTLIQCGAVSEETVREMAQGALKTLNVDVALAVSGIAGPDGGTADKPVGTVWMAVADRSRTVAKKFLFGRDRLKNIQMTGVFGLNMVRKFLQETR